MKSFIKHFKPFRFSILLLLLFTLGQTWANLSLPDYLAKIVNEGIIKQNIPLVYRYGLIMLAFALVGGLLTIAIGYLSARLGAKFSHQLRNKLFTKVENFSLGEFNKFSTASLITRSTNDIQQIQTAVIMTFRMALMAPVMGVIAIVKAYQLAPAMTWIMAAAILALLIMISFIFWLTLPKFKKIQALVDRLNLITREMLTGLRVIRAFGKEKLEEERFGSNNQELTKMNLIVNRLMAIMHPGITFLLGLAMVAVVWFGAKQIDLGVLPVGNMMAFMQYVMQAIFSFQMISMMFIMIPRVSVSINRVEEVLQAEPAIVDSPKATAITKLNGAIEFKNVSFTYEEAEEPVLKNISFIAQPGETTAIIGSTGSGKSTLIQLIPRFYEASQGQVLIKGIDVKDMRQQELREQIAYIPQKAILFSGDILENISYSDEKMSTERVVKSLEVAQASEFVNELEMGIKSKVAQAGANFSGGQKQRLAIARALAKSAEIYIFDDSFSALDFRTDLKLRQELKDSLKGKTVLIVAQRVSTIMEADKIIVLDSGELVSEGRHEDLLVSSPIYREIALSQLSAEELGLDQEKE
ncbi:MAG: ABC transporter ATP-binding protein [Patescibacteria group bacterium]|jgi:ATP-binding cassette subfamily B multidrug efflux pump